jgi:hypothetical protein
MSIRRIRTATLVATLGVGSFLFQSCPLGGLLDSCFGENTISESAYDDLSSLERLAYEENDCGRYERRSGLLGDLF